MIPVKTREQLHILAVFATILCSMLLVASAYASAIIAQKHSENNFTQSATSIDSSR